MGYSIYVDDLDQTFERRAPRVLIADDSRVFQVRIRSLLEREAFDCRVVEDGDQALAVIAEGWPDLLLLDIEMPGPDGLQICQRVKSDPKTRDLMVLLLTARDSTEDLVHGLGIGADGYVSKPFDGRELLAKVLTLLRIKGLQDDLRLSNQRLRRFLGMAVHDLRNPLGVIRGWSEILEKGLLGALRPGHLEAVSAIQRAASGMLQQIDELLDVASIEQGLLVLDRQRIEGSVLLENSCSLIQCLVETKDMALVRAWPAHLPMVEVDEKRIRAVLENLISNALKYSPRGSTITVDAEATDEKLRIMVLDEGPGIPEDEQHLLFQDFAKLSTRPTEGEASTGLGLAICHRIMVAHGGTIQGGNRSERGAVFSFELPLDS